MVDLCFEGLSATNFSDENFSVSRWINEKTYNNLTPSFQTAEDEMVTTSQKLLNLRWSLQHLLYLQMSCIDNDVRKLCQYFTSINSLLREYKNHKLDKLFVEASEANKAGLGLQDSRDYITNVSILKDLDCLMNLKAFNTNAQNRISWLNKIQNVQDSLDCKDYDKTQLLLEELSVFLVSINDADGVYSAERDEIRKKFVSHLKENLI